MQSNKTTLDQVFIEKNRNSMRKIIVFLVPFLLYSCKSDTFPKPKSYLNLQYPKAEYHRISKNCPYTFDISKQATYRQHHNCWASVHYPKLKATLHMTYREVDNNLFDILKEVEKLTFKHTIKADAIQSKQFENHLKKVYSTLYKIEGNVATNIQFKATDSVRNVLAGALYFDVKPNYDSILPAISYIEKDIVRLVESLKWKN